MADKKSKRDGAKDFEEAVAQPSGEYILKLYIAGMTPRSRMAIENIRRICTENLVGNYELEVIDISQQPDLARREQLIATPTLVKQLPAPLRRFVGDLSDKERILIGLQIIPKK